MDGALIETTSMTALTVTVLVASTLIAAGGFAFSLCMVGARQDKSMGLIADDLDGDA